MLGLMAACTRTNVRSWNDRQIDAWYEKSCWNDMDLKLQCLDKRKFVEQNLLNPKDWESAYEFLASTNCTELPEGRIDLPGSGAYVSVSEYVTKDDADFEFHRKYIDLQYVTSGAEYIYTTPMKSSGKETRTYDEKADIGFFQAPHESVFLATPKTLIVLFPDDGHKPCIKIKDKSPVRKIVVKIPVAKQ